MIVGRRYQAAVGIAPVPGAGNIFDVKIVKPIGGVRAKPVRRLQGFDNLEIRLWRNDHEYRQEQRRPEPDHPHRKKLPDADLVRHETGGGARDQEQ